MTGARDPLEGVASLDVRQDAVAGRRFRITDPGRQTVLTAFEESDSFARLLFGRYRPCTYRLVTPDQFTYLELRRPFRFAFFELTVRDARGLELGRVERDFSLIRPKYSVFDAIGREVYRIRQHPRDAQMFVAMHGERQAALLHRLIHDTEEADLRVPEYFRVSFADDLSLPHRRLLLGAIFLVHEDRFGKPRVTVEVEVGGR